MNKYQFNSLISHIKNIIELDKGLGSLALMTRPTGDALDVTSFTVYVLETRWNDDKEKKLNEDIHKLFDKACLNICKFCKKAYQEGDNSVYIIN